MTDGKAIRGEAGDEQPCRSNDIRAEVETIRDIRRVWGMKQHELAAVLGCSQSTVSKWERGKRGTFGMSAHRLKRLREASQSRGLMWRSEWSQALGVG